MENVNFLQIFELKLFLQNQVNSFFAFFLQIPLRAAERKIFLYHMTHCSVKRSMKKQKLVTVQQYYGSYFWIKVQDPPPRRQGFHKFFNFLNFFNFFNFFILFRTRKFLRTHKFYFRIHNFSRQAKFLELEIFHPIIYYLRLRLLTWEITCKIFSSKSWNIRHSLIEIDPLITNMVVPLRGDVPVRSCASPKVPVQNVWAKYTSKIFIFQTW